MMNTRNMTHTHTNTQTYTNAHTHTHTQTHTQTHTHTHTHTHTSFSLSLSLREASSPWSLRGGIPIGWPVCCSWLRAVSWRGKALRTASCSSRGSVAKTHEPGFVPCVWVMLRVIICPTLGKSRAFSRQSPRRCR